MSNETKKLALASMADAIISEAKPDNEDKHDFVDQVASLMTTAQINNDEVEQEDDKEIPSTLQALVNKMSDLENPDWYNEKGKIGSVPLTNKQSLAAISEAIVNQPTLTKHDKETLTEQVLAYITSTDITYDVLPKPSEKRQEEIAKLEAEADMQLRLKMAAVDKALKSGETKDGKLVIPDWKTLDLSKDQSMQTIVSEFFDGQ